MRRSGGPKVGLSLAVTCALLTLGIGSAPESLSSAVPRPAAGRWEGFITMAPGRQMFTLVTFSVQPDGWRGTIDVPGAEGLPLTAVRIDGSEVHFDLRAGPDLYVFDGRREGDRITGAAVLGERSFPVALQRLPDLPLTADRVEAWRQDLDAVLNRFLAYDMSFSDRTRRRFRTAIGRIDAALPEMNDQQVIVALSRAVSLSGNAHTRLYLLRNRTELRRLPVRVHWFRDGLFVVRVTAEHRDLAGCRVVRIAGSGPRALSRKVSRLFAGNASWVDYKSTYFMTSPEILYGLGLISEMESVRLEVECADRGSLRRNLPPLPLQRRRSATEAWRDLSPLWTDEEGDGADWISALPAGAAPLYLRRPGEHYWAERLPDHDALYVQYNRAQNMESGPGFSEFSAGVLASMERHSIPRLILDLRFNTGGDNTVAAEFLEKVAALNRRDSIRELYVIIGRATFSAGISAAAYLRQHSGAVFVGEPVGDELDTWSEGGNIVLPNSGLTVHFTNGFHSLSNAAPPEKAGHLWTDLDLSDLKPERSILPTSAEYFAGRDPVLEAILRDSR